MHILTSNRGVPCIKLYDKLIQAKSFLVISKTTMTNPYLKLSNKYKIFYTFVFLTWLNVYKTHTLSEDNVDLVSADNMENPKNQIKFKRDSL